MIHYRLLLMALFVSAFIYGQSSSYGKRNLAPEDYKLFENVDVKFNDIISNNGDWFTYLESKNKIGYNSYKEVNTVVASTKGNKSYKISDRGIRHQFSTTSEWYAYATQDHKLGLIHLKEGNKELFSNVLQFGFSTNGKFLVYLRSNHSEVNNQLVIRELITGEELTLSNVSQFKFRPNFNDLLYVQLSTKGKNLKLLTLGNETPSLIVEIPVKDEIKKLIWNEEGNVFAFLRKHIDKAKVKKTHCIHYYELNRNKIITRLILRNKAIVSKLGNLQILESKLKFTPSGEGLYFKVSGQENQNSVPLEKENSDSSKVQVYSSTYKLFSGKKKSQSLSMYYGSRLAHWYPKESKLQLLETKDLPEVKAISNDGNYLVSYDPLHYVPDYSFDIPKDLYLTNLKTGEQQLFLKGYSSSRRLSENQVNFSSNSQYINYFKDNQWWVYDLNKQSHINITEDLGLQWHKGKDIGAGTLKERNLPYGSPGWTKGGELIVYDKYDVWLITPKGKARRITNGRFSKISYRIQNIISGGILYFDTETIGAKKEIDISKGLVFKMLGADYKSGYSLWHSKKDIKKLVYKKMKFGRHLLKAKDKYAFVYKEESFKIPPRIQYLGEKSSESSLLKESNLHLNDFHWGNAELIYYKGPKGEDLKGVLYYPSNYNPENKYPMIVSVYEQRSQSLHNFKAPSIYMQDRLNHLNFILDGYFVLFPDIQYTLNEVGMSALRCVESAVDKVIEKGIINPKLIGLEGHSFGGYETNFIITKTNRFAAAVVGAGVSDVVSSFHGFLNPYLNTGSNFILAEGAQAGYTNSFYETPEIYLGNSPIHHAQNIDTPLLLWAGKNDNAVDYRQSFEMYFGLRRQGKICELVFYPDEGHNLKKPHNQIDLNKRIKSWFDKYLKPNRALKNDPVEHFSDGARMRRDNKN